MTKSKIKGILNTIINIAGNGAIFMAIPSPYKVYAILGFNILQVIYAYLDPTYTVEMMEMGKMDRFGNKK